MTRAFLSTIESGLSVRQRTGSCRDTQVEEDRVPEVVVEEQGVDGAQEVAGLRTLDDPVVVGRESG